MRPWPAVLVIGAACGDGGPPTASAVDRAVTARTDGCAVPAVHVAVDPFERRCDLDAPRMAHLGDGDGWACVPRPDTGCEASGLADGRLGRRIAEAALPEEVPSAQDGGCVWFFAPLCGPIAGSVLGGVEADACCYLLHDGGHTCGAP